MSTPTLQALNSGPSTTTPTARKNAGANAAADPTTFALLLQAADAVSATEGTSDTGIDTTDTERESSATAPVDTTVAADTPPALLQALLGTQALTNTPVAPTETPVDKGNTVATTGTANSRSPTTLAAPAGDAANTDHTVTPGRARQHTDAPLELAAQARTEQALPTAVPTATQAAPAAPGKGLSDLGRALRSENPPTASLVDTPTPVDNSTGNPRDPNPSGGRDGRSGGHTGAGVWAQGADGPTPNGDNSYAAVAADAPAVGADNASSGSEVQFWSNAHVKHASLNLQEDGAAPLGVDVTLDKGEAALTFHSDDAGLREAIERGAEAALGDMFKDNGLSLAGLSVGTRQPSSDQGTNTLVAQRRLRVEASADEAPVSPSWRPTPGRDPGRALDVYA
jgi:hypothetical protein